MHSFLDIRLPPRVAGGTPPSIRANVGIASEGAAGCIGDKIIPPPGPATNSVLLPFPTFEEFAEGR